MKRLKIRGISKSFHESSHTINVLDSISIEMKNNEFVSIVGPSGCGKTTLLRIAAGLEKADKGSVKLNSQTIESPTKSMGLVFQEHACFPWLTVRDNIAFGPSINGMKEDDIKEIADNYIGKIGLKDFADTHVNKLSVGMRQRVAVARMLANDPDVILMDEPFGSLDAQTRRTMQEFLLKLWEQNRKPILFVTHDIDEALFMSDRIIVLSPRPSKIIKEIKIDFKRPRDRSLFGKKEYINLREMIWSLLRIE